MILLNTIKELKNIRTTSKGKYKHTMNKNQKSKEWNLIFFYFLLFETNHFMFTQIFLVHSLKKLKYFNKINGLILLSH